MPIKNSTSDTKKQSKHTNPLDKSWWTKTRIIIIIIVALILSIVYETFGTAANIRFYKKWQECGQKPVAVMSGELFGGGVPHYIEPNSFEASRSYPPSYDYYCTPHDAEMHGYSANPDRYEFKYTTQQERYNTYLQQNKNS